MILSIILLIICTALSTVMTVSAILSGLDTPTKLFPFLTFLPITIYFWLTCINLLLHPKSTPDVTLKGRKFQLLILFLILVSLSSLGYKSILKNQKVPEENTPLIVKIPPSPTLTPTPTPIKLTLIHPEPEGLVNLRENPSTASKLLTKLKSGTQYEILDTQSKWYKIYLDSTTSGWIYTDYATLSATPTNQ